MERWQPIDTREDPDEPRFEGDPADLVDARAELVELLYNRPAFHARAACRGMGWEPWFPVRGQATAPAKALCDTCAVRTECLEAALSLPVTYDAGIWGGLSERTRRLLRQPAA